MTSLSAAERETIILTSDADDVLIITTYQVRWITRLRKNRSAVLIAQGKSGSTKWAKFHLPSGLLSLRSTKVSRTLTPAEIEQKRELLATARKARAKAA